MAELVVQTRNTFIHVVLRDPEARPASLRRAKSCPPMQARRCGEEERIAKDLQKMMCQISDTSDTEGEGTRTPSTRVSWADIYEDSEDAMNFEKGSSQLLASIETEVEGVRTSSSPSSWVDMSEDDDVQIVPNSDLNKYAAKITSNNSAVVLVLQNIPTRVLAVDFVKAMEACNYSGRFEYLYLPCKPRSGQNRGYAFAGFTSFEEAHAFTVAMHGSCFPGRASKKALEVELAASRNGISEKMWRALRTMGLQTQWGPILDAPGGMRVA